MLRCGPQIDNLDEPMMNKTLVLNWCLGMTLLAVAINGPAKAEEKILAKINGSNIFLDDFNRKYQESTRFQVVNKSIKKDVLEDLIKRELAIQEARKIGLDKDPVILERMDNVLYHALLEKKLANEFEKIHVTDAEAESYYKEYPEIRTSHVFVAVRPDSTAEVVQKAKERIQKVAVDFIKKNELTFAEIAQRFSESPSAPMGGDLDYQTRDKLDPAYYDAALALRTPGKVSGVIQTQFGFHIVKLTAIRPWDEADHPKTKQMVFEKHRKEIFDKYVAGLRRQAKIEVHESLLK